MPDPNQLIAVGKKPILRFEVSGKFPLRLSARAFEKAFSSLPPFHSQGFCAPAATCCQFHCIGLRLRWRFFSRWLNYCTPHFLPPHCLHSINVGAKICISLRRTSFKHDLPSSYHQSSRMSLNRNEMNCWWWKGNKLGAATRSYPYLDDAGCDDQVSRAKAALRSAKAQTEELEKRSRKQVTGNYIWMF